MGAPGLDCFLGEMMGDLVTQIIFSSPSGLNPLGPEKRVFRDQDQELNCAIAGFLTNLITGSGCKQATTSSLSPKKKHQQQGGNVDCISAPSPSKPPLTQPLSEHQVLDTALQEEVREP